MVNDVIEIGPSDPQNKNEKNTVSVVFEKIVESAKSLTKNPVNLNTIILAVAIIIAASLIAYGLVKLAEALKR